MGFASVILAVFVLWPALGVAQVLVHPNLVSIQAQVDAAFAKIKVAQADLVQGKTETKDAQGEVTKAAWPKKYMQGLASPANIPDGKLVTAFPTTGKPTDMPQGWGWNDLLPDPKPVDTTRVQLEVHEYVGPQGVGYTMFARVKVPATDAACLAIRPTGPDCVWIYFEHVGPETYKDKDELTWTLQPEAQ